MEDTCACIFEGSQVEHGTDHGVISMKAKCLLDEEVGKINVILQHRHNVAPCQNEACTNNVLQNKAVKVWLGQRQMTVQKLFDSNKIEEANKFSAFSRKLLAKPQYEKGRMHLYLWHSQCRSASLGVSWAWTL